MAIFARLRAQLGVLRKPRRTPEVVRLLWRRPAVMLGVGAFEAGLFASGRVDARLKALAQIKTSALIGCPF